MPHKTEFMKELETLLNKHSMENYSNTPDFILARFMHECMIAFNSTVKERDEWYADRFHDGNE